ncbi:unnamed protein product [Cercospora beticola]|nr:unnamed protein product [Cercospora beticola]
MARLFDIAFYLGAVILSLFPLIAQAQDCPVPCDRYETKYEGQTCGVDPANDSTLLFSVKFCPCNAEAIRLSVSGVLENGLAFDDGHTFEPLPQNEGVLTRIFGIPVRWNDVATSSIVYLSLSKQNQIGTVVSFTHSPMVSQFFVVGTATVETTLSTVTITETVPTITTTTTTTSQQTATDQCTTGTLTTTISTSTSTSTSTIIPAIKKVTTTKYKTITTTISCIPPKRNGPRNADTKLHRRQLQGEEFPFCAPTDGNQPVSTFYVTGVRTTTITISTATATDTEATTLTSTASETPDPATTTVCNNVEATSQVTATTTTTITTTLKRRTLTKTYTKTSTKTKFYGGKPKCCPTPYKPKGKGGRA